MKEEEIRPANIFDEYLRLAKQDTETYFRDAITTPCDCPACGKRGVFAFLKHGFAYDNCPACHSLFVSPRPAAIAFSKYYTESPSSTYWATTFYKETAAARKEKLWRPKARLVLDLLEHFNAADYTIIDIGGGYGLFAEEILEMSGHSPLVIEPGPALAESCREKKLPVIEKFLEQVLPAELPAGPKVFVSFELFEHLHDPQAFLCHLKQLMGNGDFFMFTTLSSLGLDIQVLWDASKSVSPPHHLNFFNPGAIRILLERAGFETLEVTTPGKLDIDILCNNRSGIHDRFWKSFVETATEEEKSEWQKTIAMTGRSSHMMVICRNT